MVADVVQQFVVASEKLGLSTFVEKLQVLVATLYSGSAFMKRRNSPITYSPNGSSGL